MLGCDECQNESCICDKPISPSEKEVISHLEQRVSDLIAEKWSLEEENKKLRFMIENGLGWEDLKNEI